MYYLMRVRDGVVYDMPKPPDLETGNYLISILKLTPQSDLEEYRAAYFAKLDFLCKQVGEKRYDLHNHVKLYVLSELINTDEQELSTKSLKIPEQWATFLHAFELWCFTNYNVILP